MMCSNPHKKTEQVIVVDLITTEEDKKFAPAAHMATAIIAITKEQGACLPQDLNSRGFTSHEVAQHWHMAHSIATVEMKLMCEDQTNLKSIIRRK